MSIIRILPEKVASRIAAGEVVDRPASVVRELMDNAIDAGADRIVVQIDGGGKRLVRVRDNGIGMSRDDLLMCVERHATSKIREASDLFAVTSLGFRGEALPSIAAVSRMKLVSRLHDQLAGHRLEISGGSLRSIEETGAPAGTAVEVESLFFNVPARRKFLRTSRTETAHIVDVFSRLALAYPGIHFRLEDAGSPLMNLPVSEDLSERLAVLMGRKVSEAMTEAVERYPAVTIRAYLAPFEFSRSRGDRLFAYVNGRSVRDRLVTRAIMEGYGRRLMKGQYPYAVIFMEMDPALVDVNVHPAKQEVRFHKSREVFQAIVSAVENAFSRRSYGPAGPVGIPREPDAPFVFDPDPAYSTPTADSGPSRPLSVSGPADTGPPRVIGQLGKTYILCEVADGLLMVDQHAAHERVVYERLRKGVAESGVQAQAFLLPVQVELSAKEKQIAMEKADQLSRLGVDLDHFGGETFLLRSVPALLSGVDPAPFLSELLAALESGDLENEGVLDGVLTVMACHGAVRAGFSMHPEEISHLFCELESAALPTNCPHGRPIFRHITYREIEKMFKRVV